MSSVEVPFGRLAGWLRRFVTRNGDIVSLEYAEHTLIATTSRGGSAQVTGAWDALAVADPGPGHGIEDIVTACAPPHHAAVILVRRGGFSLGLVDMDGAELDVRASKTGSTYVQGRTAAGGQSQQRFARRRANQADKLVKSAETAAQRVFSDVGPLDLLITGGDRPLIDDLLGRPALSWSRSVEHTAHVPVPTPKRRILDDAVTAATSLRIQVDNAPEGDLTQ
ncbi:hypothetical protein CLV47_102250 [Antricoccus suffuscus]|uniref:Actinobacteria/chloroflexi VLRF1 release factor domain-containing protein n=1 Tax=Antricoccus suffuscus TaxID=1629062 RepID=A0A2T1A4N6_9ACTN|nr:acVLRF1 family peptidyl-tRNA hydrolase [Antricoccus suffuscus]PRZ43562.1 hypothetical protein CLV47_102250 [Antricoccus suffuscus]